jgi:hypothetical protein
VLNAAKGGVDARRNGAVMVNARLKSERDLHLVHSGTANFRENSDFAASINS